MAKIKMTENELKQIIRESVETILKEGLDDDRNARFARRYNRYNDAANNYNTNFTKDYNQLSPDEQQKWVDKYNKTYQSGAYKADATPETMYNQAKNQAKSDMDRYLNKRGVGAEMKKQLDSANNQLKNLYTILGAKDYKSAAAALSQLKMNLQTAQSKLDTANQNISNLQQTNNQLTIANKNLNKQIAASKQAFTQQAGTQKLNTQNTAQLNTGGIKKPTPLGTNKA